MRSRCTRLDHSQSPISSYYHGYIDFNTVNINCPVRMCFLIHPWGWIHDARIAAHCIKLGCIHWVIWKSLDRQGYSFQPNTSPRLGSLRTQYDPISTGSVSPWYLNSVPVHNVCIVHSLQFAEGWPIHDICINCTVGNLPPIHLHPVPWHDLHTMCFFPVRELGFGAG